MGYHCDKPLLYYSRKLAVKAGYEVLCADYKVSGKKEPDFIKQAFLDASSQTEGLFFELDFSSYEKIICLSKSIGSAVALSYCKRHSLSADQIIFTPVPLTFDFFTDDTHALVFHGNSDPLCENPLCKSECEKSASVKLVTFSKANHSLETGEILRDVGIVKKVMALVERFV